MKTEGETAMVRTRHWVVLALLTAGSACGGGTQTVSPDAREEAHVDGGDARDLTAQDVDASADSADSRPDVSSAEVISGPVEGGADASDGAAPGDDAPADVPGGDADADRSSSTDAVDAIDTAPPIAPMLASVWPSSPTPGGAVFLTGLNLQAIDHLQLGPTGIAAQAMTTTPGYVVALLPADAGLGVTTLAAVSKSGARSELPLEILRDVPAAPAGPVDGVTPRNPGEAGFNPPDVSNQWVNEFDPDDTRYLFVQKTSTASGVTFTGLEGAATEISGTYDRASGMIHFLLGPAAGTSFEEYAGIFSDTNFIDCARMFLFPRWRGRQLLLQFGNGCPRSSPGAVCAHDDACRSGTACVSGRCMGPRALRISLGFSASTDLLLSVATPDALTVDRFATLDNPVDGAFFDEGPCVDSCPPGVTYTHNVIFPQRAPVGDYTIQVSNNGVSPEATFQITVTDETGHVLRTYQGAFDETTGFETFPFTLPTPTP